MRLVHLSDPHLGYRQYHREVGRRDSFDGTGRNARQVDISRTFARVIGQIIPLRPDLVVIAGDVFHTVRPANPAIVEAFEAFTELVAALPDTLIVMIAGNHDLPRDPGTGCILPLFEKLGIRVVTGAAQRLDFPERDLSILCVPESPEVRLQRPPLEPDPARRFNVLLLHGEVEGMMKRQMPNEISREQLGASRWTYVALGHYHVYRSVAMNAYYSGSIDYTSTDTWGEVREEREHGIGGKCFIERDLVTGAHTFHPIAPARAVLDLEPFDGSKLSVAEMYATIRARVDAIEGGIDGKIVRLRAYDVPRSLSADMDYKEIRDLRARAFHFQFETLRPQIGVRVTAGSGVRNGRRIPLEERVATFLGARLLEAGLDNAKLTELGLHYLAVATEADEGTVRATDTAADAVEGAQLDAIYEGTAS